jgi:cytochrome c oxidase cbb3-type subunit 3
MADFTSGFWDFYIGIITLASIAACAVLLKSLSRKRVSTDATSTTGHLWDEDLGEYNNPLPRWWIWMFYLTIIFGLAYLWFYPGLGSYAGSGKWTSAGEYRDDVAQAEREYGPLFQKFAAMDVKQAAADPAARAAGQKLFLTYCAQCHSSDAGGSRGFPNLTDKDWLYGGEPEIIKTTILNGRNGIMPPFGPVLGDAGVKDVAHYVRSLSGLAADDIRVVRGKAAFAQNCAACHGPDGKGNQQLGAPNLTDKTWLYGSSEATIIETVTKGRNNLMPAQKDFLGEARVHILAAYVYGLSHPELTGETAAK